MYSIDVSSSTSRTTPPTHPQQRFKSCGMIALQAPKDNEAFFAKMKLLYDTELRFINKDLDKYGVHLPPPCQQRRPRTKNSTQHCQRMPLSCR